MKPLSHKKTHPLLFAFFLPFVIVSVCLLVGEIYPLGDGQILAHDMWHQYYPFFVSFREKLLSGGSLQYTWDVGMGTSYPCLFAYYLASPLYLLSVLVPSPLLREYFALMVVLKISCAGLFFAYFLQTVYNKRDYSISFFSLLFSLCAFVAGYYWNIIWLDTFALLPLLIAATVRLLRDGTWRLYVAALSLSLWCNYYLSYFCCIFVALSFFAYCICKPNGFRGFVRRLCRISLCTLLGVGLTAILLLPTLYGMLSTYSVTGEFPNWLALNIAENAGGAVGDSWWSVLVHQTLPGVLYAMRRVLSGLLTSTMPTKMEGLPNLFCSFSAVVLAVFYFCCKKVSLREKLVHFVLLLFLALSFIFRVLDYVWHGFHFPNMIPYRFSFLFSFVLISMAYRAYLERDSFRPRYLLAIIPVCLGVIACGIGLDDSIRRILLSLLVLGLIIAFLLLSVYKKSRRNLWETLFALLLCAEMTASFALGLAEVALSTRSVYPKENNDVQTVLAAMEAREEGTLFWRTETTTTQTLNDGALNGYHGVSVFSSSANARFNQMSRPLGLASWPASNRYVYYHSSPFTNLMCGIKYLISRDGKHLDTDYTTLAASSGNVLLLENEAYISLGFVTDAALGEFVVEEAAYNPIREQEEMFRLATGIEEPLYTHLTHDTLTAAEGCSLTATGTSGTQYNYSTMNAEGTSDLSISYTVEQDALLLVTSKSTGNYTLKVYRNGELITSPNIKVRSLLCIGSFRAGDVLTLTYPVEKDKHGTISADVAMQNNAVFDAGYEMLSQSPWQLTEFSDTYIEGTVSAETDGLFYTSVPYDSGWRAYVDGKEVALAANYDPDSGSMLLTDAMISFPITAGSHTIVLQYAAPGLKPGAIISLISLLGIALLQLLTGKRAVLLPDPPMETKSEESPETNDETFPEAELPSLPPNTLSEDEQPEPPDAEGN